MVPLLSPHFNPRQAAAAVPLSRGERHSRPPSGRVPRSGKRALSSFSMHDADAGRLPPGQVLTEKWPVLTYGETPRADLSTWNFRVHGLVDREVSWTWPEFLELPRVRITSDI